MYTLPKFNSSPLKSYQNPIGKELVFQQPFFGGYVKLRGGYIYIHILYFIYHTPWILVSKFGIHHISMREVPAWTYLPSLCIHHSKQLDQLLENETSKEIHSVYIYHTLECFFRWYISTFHNDEFEKKECLPKNAFGLFFFARATVWRPFLSRRAFHDHQVEGCGFVGLTFPGWRFHIYTKSIHLPGDVYKCSLSCIK